MSKFKYHGRSDDDAQKAMTSNASNYDSFVRSGIAVVKPKEGENVYRILPNSWDPKDPKYKTWGNMWYITIWIHWGVGADKASYLCLNKMKDEDCPICEALTEIDDEDMVKELKAKASLLAWVVDRDAQKEGPQVWRLGDQMKSDIIYRSQDRKSGAVLPIDHPDRGYDVIFNRKGTDVHTKYDKVEVDRDDTPLHSNQDKQDKWLDFIADNPLPDILNYYDYDYLAKVFKGKKSKKASDDDDDDKPTRSRRSSRNEEAEEEDTRGASRSRRETAEDEPKERSRSRGSRDEEADEDKPKTRRARAEEEPEEEDRSSRRRSRESEDDKEDPESTRTARTSRTRPAEDDEVEDRSTRSTRRSSRVEPDEDDKMPTDKEMKRNSTRAVKKEEPEEDEPEEEEDDTTTKAKGRLERLRPKGK